MVKKAAVKMLIFLFLLNVNLFATNSLDFDLHSIVLKNDQKFILLNKNTNALFVNLTENAIRFDTSLFYLDVLKSDLLTKYNLNDTVCVILKIENPDQLNYFLGGFPFENVLFTKFCTKDISTHTYSNCKKYKALDISHPNWLTLVPTSKECIVFFCYVYKTDLFSFFLVEQEEIFKTQTINDIFHGLLLGALLISSIFSFIYYFKIRIKSFLFFSLFLMFYLFYCVIDFEILFKVIDERELSFFQYLLLFNLPYVLATSCLILFVFYYFEENNIFSSFNIGLVVLFFIRILFLVFSYVWFPDLMLAVVDVLFLSALFIYIIVAYFYSESRLHWSILAAFFGIWFGYLIHIVPGITDYFINTYMFFGVYNYVVLIGVSFFFFNTYT